MMKYNKIGVVTCRQMREIDKSAIESGLPGIVLMENAALAVVKEVLDMAPEKVQIFCGKGQNGGDGFAVARHLINKGVETKVILLCNPDEISGDALLNFKVLSKMDADITLFDNFVPEECDLLVDALLGTGTKGEIKGDCAKAVEYINSCSAKVISVDIPSGINGDTGKVLGTAVRADVTVTFAFPKTGLCSDLSADYIGKLVIADISIPDNLDILKNINTFLITAHKAKKAFPKRSRAAHKGDMGRVAIIGGSEGMAGAVYMACAAAERGGAGLVTALVPESILPVIMSKITGSMCLPVEQNTDVNSFDAVLVGNGMRKTESTEKLVKTLLKTYTGTLVIDADGLNVLKGAEDIKNTKAKVIITPHVGEMSRLTNISSGEIAENKIKAAQDFARSSNAIVVLKGCNTVVALPEGKTYINKRGTPAMAKGGSGDVLAGLITAVCAKGTSYEDAVCGAVYVHAVAGELAEKEMGEYSVIPQEIIDNIGKAISNL